jgi:enamine deaminase RidA (YjgF/YER057c/UK114 family)
VRAKVRDGGGFGEVAAYSRAVRFGPHVAVSGTAPLADGVILHPGDSYRQTLAAIERAEPANTTYYVGSLIPEGALVEVELDAAVDLPK